MSYTSELNSIKGAVVDEVKDQLREDDGDSGYTEDDLYQIGSTQVSQWYLSDGDLVECLEEVTPWLMGTKMQDLHEPQDIRGALDAAVRSCLHSDVIDWINDEFWTDVEGVQLYGDDIEELSE
jgi:hypothetical protein